MKRAASLLAAAAVAASAPLPLPYTLNLTGQGPFYAKVGLPSCLAAAQDDLERQKRVVARSCARDGGALQAGEVTQTLVQGVHCTAVQPLTCELPGRQAPPPQDEQAGTDGPPRA